MELELSRESIKALLENSFIIIKEKAFEHRITLDLQVANELSTTKIAVDRQMFNQIMFNLLSNAAKFTPEGGSITTKAYVENGKLVVGVADTGIGVRPEDVERIFNAFEQVDTTYSRETQGTGLGLTLAKKFVELHGGQIWVESPGVGKGSTFYFTIPIKDIKLIDEDSAIRMISESEHLEYLPMLADDSKSVVLVVEDDPKASELLAHYLYEGGYSAVQVPDGEQLLEKVRELNPYAILMDIMLPKKDGIQLLAELKVNPETHNIPVIIISVTEKQQLAFTLGAVDWLVKPVDKKRLTELLAIIKRKNGKETNTVLIIDDESQTVDFLSDILGKRKYKVMKAYSSQQGIDLAIQHAPDAIILDLLMPYISGFEVVEILRAHPKTKKIPMIIYTAKVLSSEEKHRLYSNVQGIASKPGKKHLLSELARVGKMKRKT